MRVVIAKSALAVWRPTDNNPWDRAAAAHLLRRGGFGPEPLDLDRAVDEGLERTLERLSEEPLELEDNLDGIYSLLGVGDIEHLQAWWMTLIIGGGTPLTERTTLMWHNHFATSNDKVQDVRLMHAQNGLLREAGLGDFRELLRRMAKDPAMLIWLDGNANRRGNPNENFAREVMELFALGIGSYSESDIQEAARAFTGWGTNGRKFKFTTDHHDRASKQIFGKRGDFDGEQAIELVLEHPACPTHVARRLLATFVAPGLSQEIVDEFAAVLIDCNWKIGASIDVLLRSELFFDRRFRRCRIAGPVEIIAATKRALALKVSPKRLALTCDRAGQSLFRPPSVKGWDGGQNWINAGTWLARHNELASAVIEKNGSARFDLSSTFKGSRSGLGPAELVLDVLFPEGTSEAYAATLRQVAEASKSENDALAQVTALVLSSPEYHLV
ncbi:MAG: hypothetical protein ACI8TQ_002955 [Planctomycetota bacterium]|jgi:uncharacterized protein (DUF1800 family)